MDTLDRISRLGLAGAGLALVLTFGAGAGVSAASGWSATRTGTENLADATSLGRLAANTPLRISVGLALRDQAGLAQFTHDASIAGTPAYGHYLTPAQFTERYGPTSAQPAAVAAYLRSQGFTKVHVESNRLYVTADGTASQAESAFDTTLMRYRQHGVEIYANSRPARVPTSLGNTVVAVLGLTSASTMQLPHQAAPSADTVPTIKGYSARDFWKVYDVGGTKRGSATPIAIFAEGDLTQVVKDLRSYEADPTNKLPQVPFSVVKVGLKSPDTAGADEWDMDTQTSTGIAGTVKHLYIYDATSLTDADIGLEFNRFVTQDVARAGSASFGECEYQAWADGFMVVNDEVMSEAAAQGQTVFASSGDTGSFCPVAPNNGVPAGVPDVNYPASSSYVVSVGGTTLLANADGTYNNEVAWVAGGGGPSLYEYQPYWQQGVTPPTGSACVDTVACVGKNLPDIAMDADPNTGATVMVGGQPEQIGGTSLASPLALGVWARLQTVNGNTLGFAAPRLYAMAGSAGFHDVTLGDVGIYPATPGWDYATGNGSFDIAQAATLIAHPPTVPTPPATVPSPSCRVLKDPVGDSHPIASNGNVDAMDIRAMGLSSDATNVTTVLRMVSLNSDPVGHPGLGGDGDNWYATWQSGGTEYYLGAQYPGTTPNPNDPTLLVDYSYGTVDTTATGGSLFNNVGTATGSMDLANGFITISTPLSTVGAPAQSAALSGPGAQTYASVGTPAGGLLEPDDSAGPGSDYRVGTSC